MEQGPAISVVIPVLNEMKALGSLLDLLVSQKCEPGSFEIIVVDGCSDDGTADYVREFASESPVTVILADNPGVRSSVGRNVGILKSVGDVIVFIDAHCYLPSQTLLEDTVRLFESTKADCLCRPQPLIAPTASKTGEVIARVRASILGHGRDSLIYDMSRVGFVDPASSGASYRRHVFDTVGMFDERYDACEDGDFNIRLRNKGMTAYTDPCLAVYYEPRGTIRALLTQMLRYGRGRVRLAAKHPDEASLSSLAPLVLFLICLSVLVSLWFGGIGQTILLGFASLYALLVLGASIQLACKFGLRFFWQAPAVYLTIHLGLGVGMFTELTSLRWISFQRDIPFEADTN
jgi:succinoglycan biosynthesis protein ExoA